VKDDRSIITINYEDMLTIEMPRNPNIKTYYLAFTQRQSHYSSIKKKNIERDENISNEIDIQARKKVSVKAKSAAKSIPIRERDKKFSRIGKAIFLIFSRGKYLKKEKF